MIAVRAAGFSLIELLVAVVIMAVLSGLLVLSTGTGGIESRLREQAERLRARIDFACERAELSGRDIGLHLSSSGYAFSEHRGDTWEFLTRSELAPYPLPNGMLLRSEAGAFAETYPEQPQTLCLSSGEHSPLAVLITAGDRNPEFRLTADWNLALELAERAPGSADWQIGKERP